VGFAPQIADRICFLAEGVILEQGSTEQTFSPRVERTQRL
jgi:ABC-type polar amino acid transport system ATPase subunit